MSLEFHTETQDSVVCLVFKKMTIFESSNIRLIDLNPRAKLEFKESSFADLEQKQSSEFIPETFQTLTSNNEDLGNLDLKIHVPMEDMSSSKTQEISLIQDSSIKTIVPKTNIEDLTIIKTEDPFAMVRYYNSSMIETNITQVLFNGYVLDGMEDILKKTTIPESAYVLNIMYDLMPNVRDKTGDAQPFMTESIEEKEDPLQTVVEGLKEEIFLKPINISSIIKIHNSKKKIQDRRTKKTSQRSVTWYSIHANDLESVNEMCNTTRQSIGNAPKDKITCIVWGNFNEMKSLLDRIPVNSKRCNSEGICGLVCVKMQSIRKIYEIIQQNRYNGYDKFYLYKDHSHKFLMSGRICAVGTEGTK